MAEQISGEALLESLKANLNEIGKEWPNNELCRLGTLTQNMKELDVREISIDCLKLIIEHIWEMNQIQPVTPYLTIIKFSALDSVIKSYINDIVPMYQVMKYLGKAHILLQHILKSKELVSAAKLLIPEKWLHKEIVRDLYKIIKHDLLKEPLTNFDFKTSDLINYLEYLYVEIAYSKITSDAKREIIKKVAVLLGLSENSKEFEILIGKRKDQDFIIKVLWKLQCKINPTRKYKLQCELESKLKSKVIPSKDGYINYKDLFINWLKERTLTEKEHRFLNAVSFIYGESLDKSVQDHTEFTIDFLTVYESVFTKKFWQKKQASKNSRFIAFTHLWQMILKLESVTPFFQESLILKVISVYRKLIKHEDFAEVAAQGLNLLAKIVEPRDYINKYSETIVPALALGVLMHQKSNSQKAIVKILEDSMSCIAKFGLENVKECLRKLQFLNITSLIKEKMVSSQRIYDTLYKTKEEIMFNFDCILEYLPKANNICQHLLLTFIRDVLIGNDVSLARLKCVIEEHQGIIRKICVNLVKVNKCYTMKKKDIKVALSCAQCIQILGPSKVSINMHQYKYRPWILEDKLIEFRENQLALGNRLLEYLQNLAFKENKYFLNYIASIWKLKYLLYGDQDGEVSKKLPSEINSCFVFPEGSGYGRISKRPDFSTNPNADYSVLKKYGEEHNIRFLFLYLTAKVRNEDFKKIFEKIRGVIRSDDNLPIDILPILIYLVLYYSKDNEEGLNIARELSGYFKEVLNGSHVEHKHMVFYCLDYLKKVKSIHSQKIRADVRKALKLPCSDILLESRKSSTTAESQRVYEFIDKDNALHKCTEIIQLIGEFIHGISRTSLIVAAKSVRAYKVALYHYEEECRERIKKMPHLLEYKFCTLSRDELDLLIDIYTSVNKEDMKSEYFANIIKPSQWACGISAERTAKIAAEQTIIYLWKNQRWEELKSLFEKTEVIKEFSIKESMIDFSYSETTPLSWIGKIIFLIYIWLHPNANSEKIKGSYESVRECIDYVQREIMVDLRAASMTSTYFHSFYLYLLKDITDFVETVKLFYYEAHNISKNPIELITSEKNQRKFDELCNNFLDREHSLLERDIDQLKILYFTHRTLFKIISLPLFSTLYTEKLAVLLSKHKEDYFDAFALFKECEEYKEFIIDYELQMAKTIRNLGNDYQAVLYLNEQKTKIKAKFAGMQKGAPKNILQSITSNRAYETTLLYKIKLEEKYATSQRPIEELYKELLSLDSAKVWEKVYYKYARFLDTFGRENIGKEPGAKETLLKEINGKSSDSKDPNNKSPEELERILEAYLNSLKFGHKYIWQSLPRALSIWLSLTADEKSSRVHTKVNHMVKRAFQTFDLFKIAAALPILISRYGHPHADVVAIIQDALARLTVEYPLQQAWWLLNYFTFREPGNKKPVLCESDKAGKEGIQLGELKQNFGISKKVYKQNSKRNIGKSKNAKTNFL